MDNFYKQSMLFLTYIQGPTMTKWTKAMGDWLKQSTIVRRRDKFDPLLQEQTELAFNWQYMDLLSQEWALATLENGIKIEVGGLDDFINIWIIGASHRT